MAGYGARLGGWLIDFVILFVVSLIIEVPLRHVKAGDVTFHTHTMANGVVTYHTGTFSIIAGLLQIVIVVLYGAFLCGSARGQTLGMMATGVRAVDATTGGPLGFGRACWRAVFEYLLAIVFFLPWVVDMLFPLWDPRHQTLHDKVSRSVVVRAGPPPPL